jgi:exodeoxyribonuclease V alpha subunit
VLADLHSLAGTDDAPQPLRSRVVEFQRNWRFDEQPGISALAAAIRAGDGEAAIASLRGDSSDLVHHELHAGLQEVVVGAVAAWQRATEFDDPERAAQVLRETRVLCALREGPFGVGGVTRRIEARLRAAGAVVDARSGFYSGRPILISENAPELDLANGDVGVLWLEEGRRVAFFDDRLGGLRRVAMAQLPAFLDAWAMTVHKSQGSEFDEVWLVLPPEEHPLATRDLVYTAVTRARRRLHVVGSESALLGCVEREEPRASGLASRLASRLSAGPDGPAS